MLRVERKGRSHFWTLSRLFSTQLGHASGDVLGPPSEQVKELEKSGRKKDFRQAIILDEACAECFRMSSSQ